MEWETIMELEISIEDLLKREKIESDRIEFKSGWNPDDIYRSVCAFANDYNNKGGGYIIIGVAEKNGVAQRPVQGIPETQVPQRQQIRMARRRRTRVPLPWTAAGNMQIIP